MTQKEKFKTGKYIRVAKSRTFNNIQFEKLDNDDNYWLEREFEYFFIHKKHKDILDAYLLDNSVKIEQCSNGDWYEININPYYDAFIRFYDENNEYRLKQSFEEQLINEVIGNGVETIQAPNSDKKFLKPEFEIRLYEEFESELLDNEIFARVKIFNNGCFMPIIYALDGIAYDCYGKCLSQYNLTPYKQKKEWYEDESNFPKPIKTEDGYLYMAYGLTDCADPLHREFLDASGDRICTLTDCRLATNEEIDSLKKRR